MPPQRIAELLEPFLSPMSNPCHSELGRRPGEACPERSRTEPAALSAIQLHDISTYIDMLLHWNARINLTAIRDPDEIVTRHFGESLFVARHLFPDAHVRTTPQRCSERSSAVRLADLGSGAGFPGLPIKLWAPHIALTLIESNHKKATFLREVVRALTLTEIDIMNVRAETITLTFDVVTFRAVEGFTDALRVARTLLAPAGRLALLITSSQLPTAESALPDIIWSAPIPIPRSQSRQLLVGRSP